MIRTGRGLTVYPGPFLLPTRESPMNPPFTPQYLERQNAMLKQIFSEDCMVLDQKEQTYKGSWRKRGGVGAMMMLARKWDRMENMAEGHAKPFDIFNLLRDEDTLGLTGKDGSLLAEIRDLRRYLALVEAYFLIQKQAYPNTLPPPMPLRGTQTSANVVKAEQAIEALTAREIIRKSVATLIKCADTLSGYGYFKPGMDGFQAMVIVRETAVELRKLVESTSRSETATHGAEEPEGFPGRGIQLEREIISGLGPVGSAVDPDAQMEHAAANNPSHRAPIAPDEQGGRP